MRHTLIYSLCSELGVLQEPRKDFLLSLVASAAAVAFAFKDLQSEQNDMYGTALDLIIFVRKIPQCAELI